VSNLSSTMGAMREIHPQLVRIALERVQGTRFEQFGQSFYSAVRGKEFVPLGGAGDRGADGYVDRAALAGGRAREFVLMSVQEDARGKIRHDVKRLQEVGRAPESVVYLTSKVLKHGDQIETALSAELGVVVRIRDGRYITDHINDSTGTAAAFENYLRGEVAFLQQVGRAPILARSKYVDSPDVYVFLHQEIERREHTASLVDAVIDALVLWALEGTDPDAGRFMTREAVIEKIESIIPSARTFMNRSQVNDRLQVLSSKKRRGGRAVRWHQADNHYCLPYETRSVIEEENREDTALYLEVLEGFRERIEEFAGDALEPTEVRTAADLCIEAIRRTFEREGLSFAHFLEQKSEKESRTTMADAVDQVIDESDVPPSRHAAVAEAIMAALRGAFYGSTQAERVYLSKLSRTFALLFTLRTEPALVEYFQDMAADFYLYVGSDIIVRALSERYLPREDQMTRNMLEMVRQAGATLILAEPVLDEVYSNLRASDHEFRNCYQEIEPYLKDPAIPMQSDKILVRAYFYARLDPDGHEAAPQSWAGHIRQFCEYKDLHTPAGRRELTDYLVNQFGLEYQTRTELEALVDGDELHRLTEEFKKVKTRGRRDPATAKLLARNDATMTLAVYGRREANRESGRGTEFGYKTWWLTGEGRIIAPARELLQREGRRFSMRPEFVLNFISLAPSAADVRDAYRNVFPSLQGIRLGKRLEEDAYAQLMDDVTEAIELEPGRRQAAIAKLSDALKGDAAKKYPHALPRSPVRPARG
jgi:hypothetical protein